MEGNRKAMSGNRMICIFMPGLLWLAAGGCRPEKPGFGPEYNPVRKQVGLPLIGPAWKAEMMVRFESDPLVPSRCRWGPPKKNPPVGTNGYEKMVHYLPGKILWEEDSYLRLDDRWIMKDDVDRTLDFTWLKTRYYFDAYTDRYGRDPHPKGWECELNDRNHHFTAGGPLKLTLAQADSVLHAWGVDRLEP